MFENLYLRLKEALFHHWRKRLPRIMEDGLRAESSGMTPRVAYEAGYRAAYFDAVSDMVAEGFIHTPPPTTPVVYVSDDVH